MTNGMILVRQDTAGEASNLQSFRPSSIKSRETLIQASLGGLKGGSLPALSIRGVQAQVSTLERWTDGSPRVMRAIAPLAANASYTDADGSNPLAFEEDAGVASGKDGVYPFDQVDDLRVVLHTASNGTYHANISDATSTKVEFGLGSEKGHSGPDYYKVTRYYVPFESVSGETGIHQYCGAAIFYIHERVDFDGCMVEVRVTGAALDPATVMGSGNRYDGDDGVNPGFIVYDLISAPVFKTAANDQNYSKVDLDTCRNVGATTPQQMSARYGDNRLHVLTPGNAPGWAFMFYRNGVGQEAVAEALLRGRDTAFAWSGRGFQTDSPYGFGPLRRRYPKPSDYGRTFASEQSQALDKAADLASKLQQGVATDPGRPVRNGTHWGVGAWGANQTGGLSDIRFVPTTGNIEYLRIYAMGYTKRSSTEYYLRDGDRHLDASDFTFLLDAATYGDAEDSVCTAYNMHDSLGGGAGSTHFCGNAPDGSGPGNVINSKIGDNPGQFLGLPTGRGWNSFPSGKVRGSLEETPTLYAVSGNGKAGSHNIGHSPRMMECIYAYLFGMSFLGYDAARGYGCFVDACFPAYDYDSTQQHTRFNRPVTNLMAWGDRDKDVTVNGLSVQNTGSMWIRARDGGLNPLNLEPGNFNANRGPKPVGWISTRVMGWSAIWTMWAASLGSDELRAVKHQAPQAGADTFEHNPFRLYGGLCHWHSTVHGHVSSNCRAGSGVDFYSDANGATDINARTGGLPYRPLAPDGTVLLTTNPTGLQLPFDSEWWANGYQFHLNYVSMAFEGVQDVLRDLNAAAGSRLPSDATLVQSMKPVVFQQYWHMIANWPFRTGGLKGRCPTPVYPVCSRGLRGSGVAEIRENKQGVPETFIINPNDPPTEADIRKGSIAWIDIPTDNARYNERHNQLLAMLPVFRQGTTEEKAEALYLLTRVWNSPDVDGRTLAGYIRATRPNLFDIEYERATPFVSEIGLYV